MNNGESDRLSIVYQERGEKKKKRQNFTMVDQLKLKSLCAKEFQKMKNILVELLLPFYVSIRLMMRS